LRSKKKLVLSSMGSSLAYINEKELLQLLGSERPTARIVEKSYWSHLKSGGGISSRMSAKASGESCCAIRLTRVVFGGQEEAYIKDHAIGMFQFHARNLEVQLQP
jgi:hypothetical protein